MHTKSSNKLFLTTYFIFLVLISFSQPKEKYKVFPTNGKIIFDFCFLENGEELAVADNTDIRIFSVNTQQMLSELTGGHSERILAVDVSADNSLMASSDRTGKIVIWDVKANKQLRNFSLEDGPVTAVTISPNRKLFIAGNSDGKVFVYDIEIGQKIYSVEDHNKDVTSVAFSPDGELFATAGGDKTIYLYTKDGELVTVLKGHKNWVREILFAEDGNTLISCGDDSHFIFWDLSELKNITHNNYKRFGKNWITGIDFDSNDGTLVFGTISGKIEITTTFNFYKTAIRKPINKIKLVPDNKSIIKLIVATQGKGVILINAANMKLSSIKKLQPQKKSKP
jgi:WD40 repeat protein